MISGFRNTNAAVIAENDEFLNTATVGNMPIMQYWKNAAKYLALQKMAMDYLGIPASTVQTERENSKAKYAITDIRTRLSSKPVQATMCLKSWNPILAELNDESVVVELKPLFYFTDQRLLFK